ncbi:hypothetical protein VTJ04DRAFT_5855 [Mycothermus thermophilus]|uniref:uncharacterized protein n=1 Tax=Humicola insolens TaxID=85995 RepID=UPI00374278F5
MFTNEFNNFEIRLNNIKKEDSSATTSQHTQEPPPPSPPFAQPSHLPSPAAPPLPSSRAVLPSPSISPSPAEPSWFVVCVPGLFAALRLLATPLAVHLAVLIASALVLALRSNATIFSWEDKQKNKTKTKKPLKPCLKLRGGGTNSSSVSSSSNDGGNHCSEDNSSSIDYYLEPAEDGPPLRRSARCHNFQALLEATTTAVATRGEDQAIEDAEGEEAGYPLRRSKRSYDLQETLRAALREDGDEAAAAKSMRLRIKRVRFLLPLREEGQEEKIRWKRMDDDDEVYWKERKRFYLGDE